MVWPFRKRRASTPSPASERILGDLERALRPLTSSLERSALGLKFADLGGLVRIEVDPTVRPVEDGTPIVAVVRVDGDSTSPLAGSIRDDEIDALNRFAGLCALVPQKSGARLAGRVTFYDGEEDAWRLYVGLLAAAALTSRRVLLGSLTDGPQDTVAMTMGVASEDRPWKQRDFVACAERFSSMGLVATAGDGVTVEFPTVAAASKSRGAATSMLTISAADEPADEHPVLGTGLGARLHLSLFGDQSVSEAAAALNAAEWAAADGVPFLGAWCAAPRTGDLVFASFWPALIYYHGLSQNIVTWMWGRARFAEAFLARRRR